MSLIKILWPPSVVCPQIILQSCKFIAAYSITASVFFIALVVYMQNGGESNQMYNPFYEVDLTELNPYVIYTIIFFIYMIGSSLLLLKGLYNNIRGFLLPWLIGMSFFTIFLYVWPIWLMYKYYIYIHMVSASMMYWTLSVFQFCGWLCVYAQYQNMIDGNMQSPN